MHKFIRPVLAVVLGFVIGSAVNMAFIMLSARVIPPPTGADVATMEGLKASLHLFEPKHFVFPFLAHAVGTMVDAFAATLVMLRTSYIAPGSGSGAETQDLAHSGRFSVRPLRRLI